MYTEAELAIGCIYRTFPLKMLAGACTDVIEKSLRQKKQYPPFLYDSI